MFRIQKIAILIINLFLSACISNPPEEINSIYPKAWKTFTNQIAGYSLSYPIEFEVDESRDGKDVIFRFDSYPIIAVNYVDSAEGRTRGLWVKHEPVDNIKLDGISGKKYEYTHYDAIFGMEVQSWVVSHKSKFLGLEIRKTGELGTILKKVRNSFKIISF